MTADLISFREAAALLGVPASALYYEAQSGFVRGTEVVERGRRLYLNREYITSKATTAKEELA